MYVEGIRVGLGIDRHGPDAQFLAGPDDTEGDLTPVRDQDLIEQCLSFSRPAPIPLRPQVGAQHRFWINWDR